MLSQVLFKPLHKIGLIRGILVLESLQENCQLRGPLAPLVSVPVRDTLFNGADPLDGLACSSASREGVGVGEGVAVK